MTELGEFFFHVILNFLSDIMPGEHLISHKKVTDKTNRIHIQTLVLRQTKASGVRPSPLKVCTLCWVGLVFCKSTKCGVVSEITNMG
jgi:hypothetical protein